MDSRSPVRRQALLPHRGGNAWAGGAVGGCERQQSAADVLGTLYALSQVLSGRTMADAVF